VDHNRSDVARIRVRVATFPHPYKDVCDVIAGEGPEAFGRMIAEAQPASAWMVDHVDDLGTNLETAEGKQDAAELLLEMLAALPAIEREARVRQLAERLDLRESVLRQALNEIYLRRHPRRVGNSPAQAVEQRRPWEQGDA
jgi:DNA primase